MNPIVRKGTKADISAMHGLICELALFEKAPEQVTNTINDMLHDGFGNQPVFQSLVAEVDGTVVGTAIYFVKYSTWKGKGIYLDDIIVTEAKRRMGIGKLLFDAVIEEAIKQDAKQLHWQVLDWNEPAIKFYEKYNAEMDAEWINCKIKIQ
jgi:GNAT superfamily N-acetyltransferase